MKKKEYTYIVTVVRTDYDKDEDTVFEMEYDEDDDLGLRENVIRALRCSYHGCADR